MCLIWWNLQLKADLFIIVESDKDFCKTKNMLEIKTEQLWTLNILVHVKTGVTIVKWS